MLSVILSMVFGATLSGYFFYVRPHLQQNAKNKTDIIAADNSSSTTSQSQSSPQSSASLSGSFQSQVLSQTTSNQATNRASTSTTTPSNSTNSRDDGDKATLNPSEFGVYDKYKSNQTGLMAEISPGTGTEAVAGKKLSVNYRGWLTNGQVFDQNIDTAKPFTFTLGAGSVISGWEQTIAGMKVGGERLLIIPPAAGYGSIAQGPIPANSVLIFDVKLLKVE